jgi:hypothetical protein
MPRRAAPIARLSPLQPGRRARRRGWQRVLVALSALAGLAAAVIGDVLSPLIGALAAPALLAFVLLLAVLWPVR